MGRPFNSTESMQPDASLSLSASVCKIKMIYFRVSMYYWTFSNTYRWLTLTRAHIIPYFVDRCSQKDMLLALCFLKQRVHIPIQKRPPNENVLVFAISPHVLHKDLAKLLKECRHEAIFMWVFAVRMGGHV